MGKTILIVIGAIVVIFLGRHFFSSSSLPQECLEYKTVYNEGVTFLEQNNKDGSLTSTIDMLKTIGGQLETALDPKKKYKSDKIEELKSMCITAKNLSQDMVNAMKASI